MMSSGIVYRLETLQSVSNERSLRTIAGGSGGRLTTADQWEVGVRKCPGLRPGTVNRQAFEWTRTNQPDEMGQD